jgi:hypothetical protein
MESGRGTKPSKSGSSEWNPEMIKDHRKRTSLSRCWTPGSVLIWRALMMISILNCIHTEMNCSSIEPEMRRERSRRDRRAIFCRNALSNRFNSFRLRKSDRDHSLFLIHLHVSSTPFNIIQMTVSNESRNHNTKSTRSFLQYIRHFSV